MTRNWGATSLTKSAIQVPTWQTGSSPEYRRFATLWQAWATGFIVDSRTAFGSGVRLDTIAPTFMPYPRAGWGFVTTASSIIGADNEPQTTPIRIAGGNFNDENYVAPTGSLQSLLNARSSSVLRPSFARLKP